MPLSNENTARSGWGASASDDKHDDTATLNDATFSDPDAGDKVREPPVNDREPGPTRPDPGDADGAPVEDAYTLNFSKIGVVEDTDGAATPGDSPPDLLIVNNGDGAVFSQASHHDGGDVLTAGEGADMFPAREKAEPGDDSEPGLTRPDPTDVGDAEGPTGAGGSEVIIGSVGLQGPLYSTGDTEGGGGEIILVDIVGAPADEGSDVFEFTAAQTNTAQVNETESLTMNIAYGDDLLFEPEVDDNEPGPTRPDPGDGGDAEGQGGGDIILVDIVGASAKEGHVDVFDAFAF